MHCTPHARSFQMQRVSRQSHSLSEAMSSWEAGLQNPKHVPNKMGQVWNSTLAFQYFSSIFKQTCWNHTYFMLESYRIVASIARFFRSLFQTNALGLKGQGTNNMKQSIPCPMFQGLHSTTSCGRRALLPLGCPPFSWVKNAGVPLHVCFMCTQELNSRLIMANGTNPCNQDTSVLTSKQWKTMHLFWLGAEFIMVFFSSEAASMAEAAWPLFFTLTFSTVAYIFCRCWQVLYEEAALACAARLPVKPG